MRTTLSSETIKQVDQTVTVAGWVNSRRDHGGVIFIDLRDHTGLVQLVFNPDMADFAIAEGLRDEYVVKVTGLVRSRGAGLNNPALATGEIEILAKKLTVLNKSETPVVTTRDEAELSSEELRLQYRFLDLRRFSMQKMLRRRSEFNQYLRDAMAQAGFVEIATPILASSSPEGARDFLIPSRLHPSKFYALPQAPQQFKQLLMVGGVDKYYQIAPCFRDEDPRADRLYGEFYQLDLEMSFVDDGAMVREQTTPMIVDLVKKFGRKLVSSRVTELSYFAAIETYGTDKPDLRYDMKLIELSEALQNTEFAVFKRAECVKAICVKGGASLSRSQIDQFTEIARQHGAEGMAYLTYSNDEIKSPIVKFLSQENLTKITEKTGAKAGDMVVFAADRRNKVNRVLGALRVAFADHFDLKNPQEVALAWITNFPFYEYDEANQKVDFGHNPFSMPQGGLEVLRQAKTDEAKLAIKADQYDLVMNGHEVCSGAVRNHNPEVMYEVFGALGYDKDYVEAKFGAMLKAFKFGAPPHAGCAFGLDRIFMVLMGAENIRDIVAFPKNGSGVDLMMDSPNRVGSQQLAELEIQSLS